MPQLSRRELRNSLVLIVGLASTSLGASVWFCESQSSVHSPLDQLASLGQIASAVRADRVWEPVMAGIENSNSAESSHKIEWVHPEDEVKTERSKILNGFEASF
jgi:hypothetical protein